MRPPSSGPFGSKFTKPCKHLNPGFAGSWSWCGQGLFSAMSERLEPLLAHPQVHVSRTLTAV
jgi:hypothetical protein